MTEHYQAASVGFAASSADAALAVISCKNSISKKGRARNVCDNCGKGHKTTYSRCPLKVCEQEEYLATDHTITRPESIIPGENITKVSRQKQFGPIAGGAGSIKPESYQREMIERGTGIPCTKSHMRIDKRRVIMEDCPQPMTKPNGFDYTENFDGVQIFGPNITVYDNLKCVVGEGGSQNRTLRDECYPFIEAQLQWLNKNANTYPLSDKKIYFANIFDGDKCAKCMPKYEYLLQLPEYSSVRSYVYVGDLYNYFDWVASMVSSS